MADFMDQNDFILQNLGIDKNGLGKIFGFVDFGNVNKWYDKDMAPFSDGRVIQAGQKVIVDIEKLGKFMDLFATKKFFYYGIDQRKPAGRYIINKADKVGRFKISTKVIQYIKHHLSDADLYNEAKLPLKYDNGGRYILIPKCNFDVEIAIDAVKFVDNYDTFALFSSDSDFVKLLEFLRDRKKKIILVHSGPTSSNLKHNADILINGRQVRELIARIK